MARTPRKPVEYIVTYQAQFTFRHGQVICKLLNDDGNMDPTERILPSGASVEKTCNHAESWASIRFDEQPTTEELDEIQRKLELLDSAVEAMLKP